MTDTAEPQVLFNPLQPGYIEDPFSHMAEVRALDPVHWSPIERWALFGYDDVFRLLRDPDLSVDAEKAVFPESEQSRLIDELIASSDRQPNKSMLETDPPDHTRLRRLVSKAFTPRTIESLRPRVQELVDTTLDAMEAAGGGDVIEELAFPLPFDVIAEMLGMPAADKLAVRGWSEAMVKTLDPIISDDEIRESFEAGTAMDAHIDEVVAWKRANPADDLLSAMIAAEEDGDRLSTAELRDQVTLLFIAGHETTVNLIGTGIYELMRHPEQADLLRSNPELEVNAVDELLRFVSPVQFSRRVATADLDFAGKTIESGQMVMAVLASANHDPDKWGPNADDLDIERAGAGQHLSFGSGAHYCLGASLAKLEAQVAIAGLLRRFPDATVSGSPEWNGRLNLRGLSSLPVQL